MRRTFKYLLRPTARQDGALAGMLRDHRSMYNAALQERRDAYRQAGVSIRYGDQSAQLTEIRRYDPDGQGRWSFSSQQATLRRLNRAFDAFFRRVRAGLTPGFPRFKGAGWFDTVDWPADRDGCRWDSSPEGPTRVYLQGVGHVRVHQHRPVRGRVKTISVKRDGRRWYAVLSCDDVPTQPLPPTGRAVGIDLGVASFLTTSDGEQEPSPRHLRVAAEKLTVAQQALARCKRGSNRRRSGLNRSILDAGWGVFLSILTAKAESAGRELIEVNPRNTSRTCPSCGHCCAENRVTQAEFRCVRCGLESHADLVGAVNVLRAGLARQAAPAA